MNLTETEIKRRFYNYNNKKFSESHKNFLRWIHDSSKDIQEFRIYLIYHKENFQSTIQDFRKLISMHNTDEEGKIAMKMRIAELTKTIEMLDFVIVDIKKNFNSHVEIE